MIRLKHWVFRSYWWLALILLVSTIVLFVKWGNRTDGALLVTVTGGIFSFVFFMQRQKLDELRLFKDLFTEFSRRYDSELNDELYSILDGDPRAILTKHERDVLFDYFNLCAEEHLWFKRGYIPLEVWESWYNGMRVFFADPRIRKLWDEDSVTDSYFGFNPPSERT